MIYIGGNKITLLEEVGEVFHGVGADNSRVVVRLILLAQSQEPGREAANSSGMEDE